MTATTLQTPVNTDTKAWLKGYKEARGLSTLGDAISALIAEFEERGDHLDIYKDARMANSELRAGLFKTLDELIKAD